MQFVSGTMQAMGAQLGACGCYGRVPSSSHYLTSSRRDTQPYSRGPRRRGGLSAPQSAHALVSRGLESSNSDQALLFVVFASTSSGIPR